MAIKLRHQILAGFLTCCNLALHAQITISYPATRAVFQRDNANVARIAVAGYFQGELDKIEARFVPRASDGSGVAWRLLDQNPEGGQFYGIQDVKGGWYRLEVRGLRGGVAVDHTALDRVGVGEVFLVAGQSNATGSEEIPTGPGASDDRVNSVDFQNLNRVTQEIKSYPNLRLPPPVYVHLDKNTHTAPFGNYAWCWGQFGDSMVKALNVPVMIFNAGWSGTSIRSWRETINPGAVSVSAYGYHYPQGMPFGHIRAALNDYIAQLGVRGVLWHQGEADNFEERNREGYRNDLREVIRASRELTGKSELAWVVSRVSRFTVRGSSRIWSPVVEAQNDLIGLGEPGQGMPQVYQGPATDEYFDSRYRLDQVHFGGSGFGFLADLWKKELGDNFMKNSKPYPGLPPAKVQVIRRGEREYELSSEDKTYRSYRWFPRSNPDEIMAHGDTWVASSTGPFVLEVKDQSGNTLYSPPVALLNSRPSLYVPGFRAEVTLEGLVLHWESEGLASSADVKLERSGNLLDFKAMGSLVAKQDLSGGKRRYTFKDEDRLDKTMYYRLRSGNTTSRIVAVRSADLITSVEEKADPVVLYPNPVSDFLHVQATAATVTVEIWDTMGRMLAGPLEQDAQAPIDFRNYPKGLYLVKINQQVIRVIKN